VRRWLAQEHGPFAGPRKPHIRSLNQEWALTYLRERWDAGEHNGTVLWEALQAQGYHGSLRSVYRRLAQWRPRYQRRIMAHHRLPVPPRSPWEDITPGRVVGWIIARPETVSSRDQQRLTALYQVDQQIDQACHLMRDWLAMIRQRTTGPLDSWLEQMRASGIPQFVSFARSVEQDKTAIVAGLTLPYSTGPVEGNITRLKLIKRQAYGKASLDYLQRRFLGPAG